MAQRQGTGLTVAAGPDRAPRVPPRLGRPSTVLREVPRRYFEEAAAVAGAVFAARSGVERHYIVGGLRCRVRYGDERLRSAIHPGLAHLEVAMADVADLSVGIWAETEAEPVLPAPDPRMLAASRNQCLEVCSDERYLALEESWLGTSSYIDREAGHAWHCVRDVSALPMHERAAPLRCVLNALLAARGRHLVHAAAVGTAAGGVLLAGPPAAGKSSTALACLGGRLGYLADGWCGVREGAAPGLFSVYSAAKLRPEGLARFAELRGKVHGIDDVDGDKATIFLSEHWPSSLLRECPAKAILVPEVTGGATTVIEPTTQMAAWRALISWTLSYLPGCGRASTELLTRLCGRLPAYRLALGAERREVRATLEDFVARL